MSPFRKRNRDANRLTRSGGLRPPTNYNGGLTQQIPWGGGNIAVKPATKQDPDGLIPQNQQFLVPIILLEPDRSVTPGTMAYVKVSCQYRTCAWWAWRAFSSAFDLGWDPSDWIPIPRRWQQ